MEGFDLVEGQPFKRKCTTCGSIIDTGIVSISSHWASCFGKDFQVALLNHRQQKGSPITIEEVDVLIEKHLR